MSSNNINKSGRFCTFCGRKESQANFLIPSPTGAYICDFCVDQCSELISESIAEPTIESLSLSELPRPIEIKEELDKLEAGTKYKTIIIDLVEDTYEMARLYMYKKLNITHESDDSFRAWDKVRTEYLSTMRRLLNLPYDIVLISHEDTSKDITKKSGENITAIKPNINDKVANKLAGMVALVGRAVCEAGRGM